MAAQLKKIKKGGRKKRKARPKELTGYHSNWEYKLHTGLLSKWQHHPTEEHIIKYVIRSL